jgi:hypothetical protein
MLFDLLPSLALGIKGVNIHGIMQPPHQVKAQHDGISVKQSLQLEEYDFVSAIIKNQ